MTEQQQQQQPRQDDNKSPYKVKSTKHWVSTWKMKLNADNIELELKELQGGNLNDSARLYLTHQSPLNHCCVCEDYCVQGYFAVETLLFIPRDSSFSSQYPRFHCQVPRICCNTCSIHELPPQEKEHSDQNDDIGTIQEWWMKYQRTQQPQQQQQQQHDTKDHHHHQQPRDNSRDHNQQHQQQHQQHYNTMNKMHREHSKDKEYKDKNDLGYDKEKSLVEKQQQQQSNESMMMGGNNNNNNNNNANSASLKTMSNLNQNNNSHEPDPFDDGFLICTQLVKTGGADQGGLQVGDILVEFGHYSKARFPGLKSIAMLVRKSAGKEIPVVVWRKLENLEGGPTHQRLALKVKPLQSHDANGGGVLGAVINTYPLPQTRV